MSEETELQDRIAKVLDQNFNPDQYPIMAEMFRDYAQAIIDEFGLTTEAVNRKPNGGLCSKHCLDEEHAKNSVTRVVGKWEKQ